MLGTTAEFANGLDNALNAAAITVPAEVKQGLQRIADVPIHFADAMARRAPALQKTADARAPQLRANAATLQALGLQAGESAKVRQGGGCAVLTVALDAAVPDNCLRVAAAHPTTASLGAMFGDISVERA